MSVLAVLKRETSKGKFIWTFAEENGAYYARSEKGKSLSCESVEELRELYRKFRGYGFMNAN